MNLPNKLTVLRVILIPFFILFAFINLEGTILTIPTSRFIMLVIFIVASLTDLLDGKIARKYNLVTNFGKFLDPLADKLLVNTALVILTGWGLLPSWITAIIIIREFTITGVRLLAVEQGKVIAANIWGKIKTNTQMIGIILMLIEGHAWLGFLDKSASALTGFNYVVNILASITMCLAVITTIFSLCVYLKDSKDIILKGDK